MATVTPSGNSQYHSRTPLGVENEGWRHTLGDLGGAIGRIDQDIAALGTKSRSHSLSKGVNTLEKVGTGLNTELEFLQDTSDVSELLEGFWWDAVTSFGSYGSHPNASTQHHHPNNHGDSYLVGKTLLLQVETSRSGNGSTLRSGLEERSPRGESSVHGGELEDCVKSKKAK